MSGCGAAKTSDDPPTIGFVAQNNSRDFSREMSEGFRAGAAISGGVKTEVTGPDTHDGLKQAALLQIFQKRGHRLVALRESDVADFIGALGGVVVPAARGRAMIHLDKRHARLDQPPRQQAALAEAVIAVAVAGAVRFQGQIEGATMTGIGYALMEHVIINDGKVATSNFGDYKIPTAKDIPPFRSSVTEQRKGAGPYNSMPIGETANIPVAAAVANAIEDACGVRIKSLPITAEKVYNALRSQQDG